MGLKYLGHDLTKIPGLVRFLSNHIPKYLNPSLLWLYKEPRRHREAVYWLDKDSVGVKPHCVFRLVNTGWCIASHDEGRLLIDSSIRPQVAALHGVPLPITMKHETLVIGQKCWNDNTQVLQSGFLKGIITPRHHLKALLLLLHVYHKLNKPIF